MRFLRPALFLSMVALPLHASALDCAATDLDVDMRRLLGKTENVCQAYGGKVILVVNTASQCGYTPQYEGLEKIYQRYKDRGLVVLGFPSEDFGGQELAKEEDIAEFCKANFGVSFPMFGKSAVKGREANPLFRTLAQKTGQEPGWNFNKYLVGRDGKVLAHFGSDVKPDGPKLESAIEAALQGAAGKPGT